MDQEQGYAEEFRNQVESCYSCGQCESYCPFFPRAFSILEEEQSGRKGLLDEKYKSLLDLCYDCKLCKIGCSFKNDLPRIILKAKAGVIKNGRTPFIKQIFRNVDAVEALMGWFAPVLNPFFRNRFFRSILQKMTGIHRDRLLPAVCFFTFRSRALLWQLSNRFSQKTGNTGSENSHHKVIYFYGCFTNHHRPEEGLAALRLLQASGIEVVLPPQRCCGLPQASEGFPEDAKKNMVYNVSVWKKYVAAGYDIVVTTSPCSMTIKQEYPECLGSDAEFLNGHVFEVTEYLLRLYQNGQNGENGDIQPPSIPLKIPMHRRVAYHVPCHLKAQGMGMPSLELLRLVPGLEIEVIDRGCCGQAGSMGYTEDTFDLSMEIGSPMIEGIRESLSDIAVSDCPKCNLQIQQATGLNAVHPIELLAMGCEMKNSTL